MGRIDKIADVTVSGSDANYIDLTGLDLNTHLFYLLFLSVKNALANYKYLDCLINGDTTRTNYYSQYLDQDGGSITSGRENNPVIAYLETSTELFCQAWIMRDPTGYPRIIAEQNWKRGNSLMKSERTVIKTATVANITSLRINAETAGTIAVGSRAILYGYVA